MAYRTLEISFWQDNFVMDLTPEEKFFYIYLMTNSKSTQCGVYCLPTRLIEAETGYNRETSEKLLKRFVEYGKIYYCSETKEIMIINWVKHNFNSSINACKCMNKELFAIKNKDFVIKLYSIFKILNYATDVVFEGIIDENEGACKGLNTTLQTATEPLGETLNNKQETLNNKQNNNIYDQGHTQSDNSSVDNFENNQISTESTVDNNKANAAVPYAKIIDLYNNTCRTLPKFTKKTNSRERAIKALWNNLKDLKVIEHLFYLVQNNKFLTGENNRGWRADFDWILKENHYVKILEGGYVNKKPSGNANGNFNNFQQRNYNFDELEADLLVAQKDNENCSETYIDLKQMISETRGQIYGPGN